jgi:dolichyl-phosphate beta-glucosyltransferase
MKMAHAIIVVGFADIHLTAYDAANVTHRRTRMAYDNYVAWKNTPLEGQPLISIVIPAYNEELRIVPTVGAIASHISNLGFPWELIIADDGSTDTTVELLEELDFKNLRVLRAERNGGKGSAVRRGMLAARGEFLLFDDADNSTPVEELGKLLAAVQSGEYEIAVGSRALAGAQEAHRSLKRRVLSGGLRWIVRYGLRIGVRDTQCGFKLFSRAAARQLYAAQTITGFSFDLEILYLAAKYKYRVAEVPVAWVDAPGSKVDGLREARRFVRDLLRIKWNDLRGLYPRARDLAPQQVST